MKSFGFVLSTFLASYALLAQGSYHCQSLFDALCDAGLTKYAHFLKTYAPEVADEPNSLIYAPNNEAVYDYLADNPQLDHAKYIRDFLVRRAIPDPNANAAAKGNTGRASSTNNNFRNLPPRGSTGGSGGSGAKVSRPAGLAGNGKRHFTPSYVGTITAGGGGVSMVLKDAMEYCNGFFFEIDSFTTAAQTFEATLDLDPRLAHLTRILARLPELQCIIFKSTGHTFFLPTEESMKAACLDPDTTPLSVLEEFVKDHMILNSCDFIGYTPEYVDGGCFPVYSGKTVTSRFAGFQGTQTILNDCSTIVVEDIITDYGVIQVIDKPLFEYPKHHY